MSPGEAYRTAQLVVQDVLDGTDIDAARMATHLTAVCGAATEFIGDTAVVVGSESYGTIAELMRIISGEVWEVRAMTIIGLDAGGEWQNVTERDAAITADGGTFYSDGAFLTAPDSTADTQTWPASDSFQPARDMYISGSLRASIGEGKLSSLASANFDALSNRLVVNENSAGFPTVEYTYGVDDLNSGGYTFDSGSVLAVTPLPVLGLDSITAADPAVVTLSDAALLEDGDFVWISNHDGTVAVDGPFKVANFNAMAGTFELNTAADATIEFTVAATAGSVVLTNSGGDHSHNLASNTARAIRVYDDEGTCLA